MASRADAREPVSRRHDAPPPLARVLAFVNTRYGGERHAHREAETPEQLRSWLREQGLLSASELVTEGDFRRAMAFREALRTLLHANSARDQRAAAATGGGAAAAPRVAEAVELLNAAGRSAPLRVRFRADGSAALEPDLAGVDGVIAGMLADLVVAMADGTWPRLKACRNERCGRAFYDTSKNRSATWCAMATCGNRLNASAYRRRRKQQPA